MRHLALALLLTLTTTTAAAQDVGAEPPAATEQAPSALAGQVEHLETWLKHARDYGKRSRMWGGSMGLAGSGALIGLGTALFLDDTPKNAFARGVGLLSLSFGGVFLVGSITSFILESAAEQRYERWQAARDAGMTEREFARFEGELRATIKHRDRAHSARRWGNLGLALSGGLILGLTSPANLADKSERAAYVTGGVLAGMGVVGFGLSFIKPKDLWERYESGASPRGKKKASVTATPTLARDGGGIALIGQF